MNQLNEITDEAFIPFLHSLGVETYKKSFEWMLNDPDFSDVLRWIYKNLDANNALSAREECRYLELERNGMLLPIEELEKTVEEIQKEFEGICLPGDLDAIEDAQFNIKMQNERLDLLEKQEETIKDMIRHNETTKEALHKDTTKLRAAEQQCTEDGANLGQDCLRLAEEVDSITNEVMDTVNEALDVYGNCHVDKEISKRFLAYGPFEPYRQSQALFRSHFDLYVTKKLKHSDILKEENLRSAHFLEAKNMEARLLDAILAYVETKAELCGEQAKLALVANYNNVHPSQITMYAMEAQSAIDLLEQEESILDQQLQDAAKQLVDRRTNLADETTAKSALAVRLQIQHDLKYLHDITQQALSLDRLLYCALRRELGSVEELLHFAAHLRSFVMQEEEAVLSRIQSMNNICMEQDQTYRQIVLTDPLLNFLCSILGVEKDAGALVKGYSELRRSIYELYDNIVDGLVKKENDLHQFKKQQVTLSRYIWDGCSKQANCYNTSVSSMMHALVQELADVDSNVTLTSGQFSSVKNGDKNNLRKLWQWFLTDPAKLMSAMRNLRIDK
ncbi:augmin complex subunit dgt3 [Zerene cesonia]|uniref:augmin complex subunit dgt3 n=1 Tax=Zerene cesonia TaxID=33412 RepID=UPI0018E54AD6|nr:augmin complex subunit dgt3 [Zerene cesonia]